MPVKKKAIKTEEIATETEPVTEKTENIDIPEEDLNIQKPKKPKRQMTEKQKLNFAKLQEANKLRYAEKKRLKEEATNNKITEVEIKKEEKPAPDKQLLKPVVVEEEEEEEEEVIVKKKPVKKKKKKIVIEQDSESSDEEIVISRRRGRKKTPSIPIPQETPKPEPMIDITPVEEVKKEEPELTKKYSAKQILQGIGL